MKFNIRLLYLYLFSFVGLLIFVIGAIRIIDLGIKVFVFKGADRFDSYPTMPVKMNPEGKEVPLTEVEKEEQRKSNDAETKRQRQRELSGALSMILVGYPLYRYHWKIINKDNKKV